MSDRVPDANSLRWATTEPAAGRGRGQDTQVFVHIGMPKCASTTLQHFFARNDEAHSALGFCYPTAFRAPSGYRSHLPLRLTPASELDDAVSTIAEEAATKCCDQILLSCEGLAESLLNDRLAGHLARVLNSAFGSENVSYIFLLRNHFHYAESVYGQFIRGGMFDVPDAIIEGKPTSSVADFADSFEALYGFEIFEYSGFYRLLREVATDNIIEVASVEPADLDDGDIVDFFCHRFDLPGEIADKRNVNRRLPGKSLLALHRARSGYRFDHFESRRRTLLQTFAGSEEGVSSLLHLSDRMTERVRRASRRDAAFFAEVLGSVPPQAFTVPAGFPRSFEHELSLSDAEVDAIRYVMEAEDPTPATGKRLRRQGGRPDRE